MTNFTVITNYHRWISATLTLLFSCSNGPEEFLVGEKNVDLPRGL